MYMFPRQGSFISYTTLETWLFQGSTLALIPAPQVFMFIQIFIVAIWIARCAIVRRAN